MTMHVANNGVSCLTTVSTSASLENREGYSFLERMRMSERTTPITHEVITATTNENLAVLG